MRLLTPRGIAGVAVVAVEPPTERRAILACLSTPSGAPWQARGDGRPRLARLSWDGVLRDEVLVVDRSPGRIELHLHGGPALLAEFERRFGPLRSAVASAADRLLQGALSRQQLALALEQRRRGVAALSAAWPGLTAGERRREVAAAIARSAVARAMVDPLRVVLVGRQNAGKSTLFNRLVFRERVLTGDTPGLTRDAVAELTTLSGYPYELVDTAGEGQADSPADAEALRRSRSARGDGLALLVIDGASGPLGVDRDLLAAAREGGASPVVIATKADLPAAAWPIELSPDLVLSCAAPGAAAAVRRQVGEMLRRRRGLPAAGPVGGPAALDDAEQAALAALAGREHAAGAAGPSTA